MGNFASRIHSKEDGKIYNILPMGELPTVVFGRVIREHSVPGMQYYFSDGIVKFKKDGQDTMSKNGGWDGVEIKYPKIHEERLKSFPCIFTVPEDLDFSRMNDVEYVKQYCRTAKNLNANTVSPYFIIRNGNIICVREIDKDFKNPNLYQKTNLDRFNISYSNEQLVNKLKKFIPKFIFRYLKKRSSDRSLRRNRYHYVNSKEIKHVLHNTILVIPCVKRNKNKIYRSNQTYQLNRFKSTIGGSIKYLGKWKFVN